MAKKLHKSALTVNKGIEQPPSVNESYLNKISKRILRTETPGFYAEGILKGSITHLSRAITLVESTLPMHQDIARQIIEGCMPHTGNSLRIGITGVPGVGKSTFIEAMGKYITSRGEKLAVLAVDPSSERSKGSILGDKTRMEKLAVDPLCFIRPSPSAGTLGGVARKTMETALLCEAAGYRIIFIETVGVGQSETTVRNMVDFFLLLMLPGAGDELQGIKRGIMEMADMLVVNKADGDNLNRALVAKNEYQNALRLYPRPESGWLPQVEICSAKTGYGIEDVWQLIKDYKNFTVENQFFEKNRRKQYVNALHETIKQELINQFYNHEGMVNMLKKHELLLQAEKETPYEAATKILEAFYADVTK